ncbi:hypothetical protein BH11MYX3_BH11MYX3_39270 [soil metagenome]
MRTMLLFTALSLSIPACTTDEACLDGVCSDRDEARTLPGPCSMASSSYLKHCDLTYDTAGEPLTASCTIYGGLEDETEQHRVRWNYDATGALSGYEREIVGEATLRWVFEPTRVRYERTGLGASGPYLLQLYDRALFAFDPGVGSSVVFPTATLGLISTDPTGAAMYTWSREGSRLTRTGPGTERHVFDLDTRGRLVSTDNGVNTYVYDGDQLASRVNSDQRFTYFYDRGGNIAETTWAFPDNDTHLAETYSYDCG